MSIPESQLATWSNQGATTTAATTYAAIQGALSAPRSRVRTHDHEVYLQGSYKNDTNVRGDSDVDVIAQLNETYYRDLDALDAVQQRRYLDQATPADYSWAEFRADVLDALQAHFGAGSVVERNKCITVKASSGRLSADVVAAAQLKRFTRWQSSFEESHHTGIAFWTQQNRRRIENFPKQHHAKGVAKNQAASERYKPTVRMFKNARSAAVERGLLAEADAPSYFVECLIFNVPEPCFQPTKSGTFFATLDWLHDRDISKFVCGSRLVWLFGSTPEKWDIPAAKRTIAALIRLWNNWG